MVAFIYPPQWFYGKDLLIDLVSILTLSLVAFFSFRYYLINKNNRNYLYLTVSFLLIALAFACKILTYFTIYYHIIETKHIGALTLTYQTIKSSDILFFLGYLLYRFLTLIGLYALYLIYQKDHSKSTIFLIVYLLLISAYFSNNAYYLFNITSLMLLILISRAFFKNYTLRGSQPSRLIFYSFSIISISQVIFIFIKINSLLYVFAEIVQLIGYILLLFAFIQVLRNAKKKK